MKIVHVNLAMGYTEGMSYQENCVSKCHAQQGHQVWVLTTPYCFNQGAWGVCQTEFDYVNPHGVHVIRLPFRWNLPYAINKQIGHFRGTYDVLKQIEPDVVCIHNMQFQDLRLFGKYKKNHPSTKIYIDNHADFSNSARNWFSKEVLYRFWWKPCAKSIEKHAEVFFGVMPSRVDFMVDVFGIDRAKTDILVMGAEDDAVKAARKLEMKRKIRKKYSISDDDFLIVTGGKIDKFKTQTLLLMQAVKNTMDLNTKLIVFGSVEDELKEAVDNLCDNNKVKYIGWVKGNESYNLFGAADFVVFPGRHSVYWEQVAGLGIPMACKYWPGTTHVDLGGNVVFLRKDSAEEIAIVIRDAVTDCVKYAQMKAVAENEGMKHFSYIEISKRAIGL